MSLYNRLIEARVLVSTAQLPPMQRDLEDILKEIESLPLAVDLDSAERYVEVAERLRRTWQGFLETISGEKGILPPLAWWEDLSNTKWASDEIKKHFSRIGAYAEPKGPHHSMRTGRNTRQSRSATRLVNLIQDFNETLNGLTGVLKYTDEVVRRDYVDGWTRLAKNHLIEFDQMFEPYRNPVKGWENQVDHAYNAYKGKRWSPGWAKDFVAAVDTWRGLAGPEHPGRGVLVDLMAAEARKRSFEDHKKQLDSKITWRVEDAKKSLKSLFKKLKQVVSSADVFHSQEGGAEHRSAYMQDVAGRKPKRGEYIAELPGVSRSLTIDGIKIRNVAGLVGGSFQRYGEAMHEAARALKRAGLGFLLKGGKVALLPNEPRTREHRGKRRDTQWGGWYRTSTDEIEVLVGTARSGWGMNKPIGSARTLIHELGHRYWYRYMKPSQHARFRQFFKKLAKEFTTEYSKKNEREDFAELFTAFVARKNKWLLRGVSPRKSYKLTPDVVQRFRAIMADDPDVDLRLEDDETLYRRSLRVVS